MGNDSVSKSKKSVGRPTKLTQELQDEIVQWLKAGNYVETVCHLVGINKSTFYDWLKQGARAKRSSNRMYQFSNAVKKAMAFSESADLALIQKASISGTWQASAWRLERRYPQRWGRKDVIGQVDLSSTENESSTPGKIDLNALSSDKLEQIERILEEQDD
jgi:transposase